MDDFVVISGKSIDEEQVLDFVSRLEEFTGAEIMIQTQWQVTSESASVMTALRALFGPQVEAHGVTPKKVTAKPVQPTPPEKERMVAGAQLFRPGPNKEIAVWEVHVPGVSGKTTGQIEKITITEKNLRLVAGKFETGTLLRHPKAGWSKVTGDKGSGQGMTEITATEAIAVLEM
jgi:hypothetical protein